MYFVSDANGAHIFSVTQKEHSRAVEFYRRQKAYTLKELEDIAKGASSEEEEAK